jgi:hypothetical protein
MKRWMGNKTIARASVIVIDFYEVAAITRINSRCSAELKAF